MNNDTIGGLALHNRLPFDAILQSRKQVYRPIPAISNLCKALTTAF